MPYYAIGEPSQPIRLWLMTDGATDPELQLGVGEVAVEVAADVVEVGNGGTIESDGDGGFDYEAPI